MSPRAVALGGEHLIRFDRFGSDLKGRHALPPPPLPQVRMGKVSAAYAGGGALVSSSRCAVTMAWRLTTGRKTLWLLAKHAATCCVLWCRALIVRCFVVCRCLCCCQFKLFVRFAAGASQGTVRFPSILSAHGASWARRHALAHAGPPLMTSRLRARSKRSNGSCTLTCSSTRATRRRPT